LAPARSLDAPQPPSHFFRRVLDDIRAIGWDHVTKVDPTLQFLEVCLFAESRRRIELRLDIPPGFPRTPPRVASNLPVPVALEWDPSTSHLKDIVSSHEAAIPGFAGLWRQLEELDRDTFVIEPREPSLGCCMRRIVVSDRIQVQIEVSPRRPFGIPKVLFIGAEAASREMRERFDRNAASWQPTESLKANLERALEVGLVRRDADELAETDFDCGICYVERLGGEIPDIVCGNAKCGKRFHRSCLVDWLRTGRPAEQSYHVVFGSCPFCQEQIQCSLVD
jgi:E3 ubiquitin-protein ligase FANCL